MFSKNANIMPVRLYLVAHGYSHRELAERLGVKAPSLTNAIATGRCVIITAPNGAICYTLIPKPAGKTAVWNFDNLFHSIGE